jgi:hypothetical protein
LDFGDGDEDERRRKTQAMEQISFTQYWNEPPTGSTVLGEETVNGRACYVVEHPKNEFIEHPAKMWIDKEYFVNVQSEAYASGKLIKSVFGDFKAIEGDYVIPHTATVTSDGVKTFDMVITKVEVNKGVDASCLTPPSWAAARWTLTCKS